MTDDKNIMWIMIDDGEVFEGTEEMFQDNFFSNTSVEIINEWASSMGCTFDYVVGLKDDINEFINKRGLDYQIP